jgi:phosphoribosylglycinamide formyltransferase-1
MSHKTPIAVFASGRGSNAEALINYSKNSNFVVALIVSNKAEALVLDLAKQHHIPSLVIEKPTFYNSTIILDELKIFKIKWIVLAGFLWLIPQYLVEKFPNKIINIHPSLLPKFGGKGMYGNRVHQAVYEAKANESGITIHFVNHEYDKGDIIFQKATPISSTDQPSVIAQKVLKLEHEYLPKTIERLIQEDTSC